MTATAPATAGAAIEVPFNVRNNPEVGPEQVAPDVAPAGTDEQMLSPAAITSTCGPSFENCVDCPVVSSTAPTVRALEIHAGDDTPFGRPSFPAAITVAIPTAAN
jgi:hypothetical protein